MKMTDQMERDFFQAEIENGHANRNENSTSHDLKVASMVMAIFIFVAVLMIWLGR